MNRDGVASVAVASAVGGRENCVASACSRPGTIAARPAQAMELLAAAWPRTLMAGKIAVEVKSFVGSSEVRELEVALGQFVLYGDALAGVEPERTLYVAVRAEVYADIFEEPIGLVLLKNARLRLVVFDPDQREVVRWIP